MIRSNLSKYIPDLYEVSNEFNLSDKDISVCGEAFSDSFKVSVCVDDKNFSYDFPFSPDSDIVRKRLEKRYLKLSLYRSLNSVTGISLPWGALTGIRPTKLAYRQGADFKKFFRDTMLVSEAKTNLVATILDAQKGIYSIDDSNADLFVSVPFCPSRCAYCSFISNEISKEKLINEYIDALINEISAAFPLISNLRSIYIGGGTPVALPDDLFEKLLDAIGNNSVEYTVEAGRPDAITAKKLDIMKAHGVTRVCVNPQTFSDETLSLIGRKHTAADIIEKFALVRSYGFDINMDLIAGLYGESYEVFHSSLETAILLAPENITVHTLCLKNGSKLKESTSRISSSDVSKMVNYSFHALSLAGYVPYYLYRQKYMADNLENTGYSKKGKQCVYNIDIMEETTDIIACGANAVSKRVRGNGEIVRIGAPKDTLTYINKVPTLIKEKSRLFDKTKDF